MPRIQPAGPRGRKEVYTVSWRARVDEFQRRHRVVGFPLAVTYKFFDDQGSYLAIIITHNAFVAIFPLLLISSSVLGFVLKGNEALKKTLLNSALNEFPIIGSALSTQEGLQGNTSAVLIGAVIAAYGIVGLGQALQNAVNTAWAVPRNSRLNPLRSRLRSVAILTGAGVVVLAVATLTSFTDRIASWSPIPDIGAAWLLTVVTVAITTSALSLALGWAAPTRASWSHTVPGALFIALSWVAVQGLGGMYVERVLARASDLNAVFALSLGLIGLLYIGATLVVVGVQINVVLDRVLYPRALLTPFTDEVDLTEADRRAYVFYAKSQRHKGFESVDVAFHPGADDPP